MPAAVKANGLSIAFGAIFLISVALQAISGHDSFNHEQALHHGDPIGLWHYVTSVVFWADVMASSRSWPKVGPSPRTPTGASSGRSPDPPCPPA